MATKPYLIFSLHNQRYAIAAQKVTEIFLLPELTPVAEAPPDIVGLLRTCSESFKRLDKKGYRYSGTTKKLRFGGGKALKLVKSPCTFSARTYVS